MQIGERLKEARIEKDLTLDDLQKETKIQKRYLESLENNDWSVLPGVFMCEHLLENMQKLLA